MSRTPMALARTAAFVASLAACAVDGADYGSTGAPILGGQSGSVGQFPTTVALFNGGLCTGTLVAPDWVLTAAHCVTPSLLGASSQQQVTDQTTIILDATSVFSGGRQLRAADTIPHPGFNVNALGDNDIGLVRLAEPVTDRDPTPINRIAADAPAGIQVRQVGYGMTQAGNQQSAGTLNWVDKTTTSCAPMGLSDANLLCFAQTDGKGKCSGDSGGPSYATIGGVERVVGVTSFGDQNCAEFGADTRVDAELDFLFEHAPELQCQADGDCNDACGTGQLPADPDCPLCGSDSDCADGEICNDDGHCEPEPFSPGGLGSPCENASDCASGLCAQGPDGGQCTDLCQPDGNSCPDGFECTPAGDTDVCWPGADDGGGGCAVGGAATQAWWLALCALVALGRRRRRA